MQTIVFRSKVDAWLGVLLAASVALATGISITTLVLGGTDALIVVPLLLLGGGLPLWVLFSTSYTLTPSELAIRSGPFRWKVALRDVRAIEPTRNPLSSPALSLDRLRVEYGQGKWIMISPKDKDAFLRAVEDRRAGIGSSKP